MKHTLAAVFMFALSAVASAAEVRGDIYGDFRMALMHFDDRTGGTSHNGLVLGDNGSAYGIKMSASERGLVAFGKYERALDTDDAKNVVTTFGTASTGATTGGKDLVREAYAGLKCPALGTILFGQAETAYSQASRRWDPFFNTGLGSITGVVDTPLGIGIGPSHGGSVLSMPLRTLGYVNNTLAYSSPNLFGVTVNGAVYTSEGRGKSSDPDYGVGAEFNGGGLTVGVQDLDLNSGTAPGSTAPNFALTAVQALLGYAGYSTSKFGAGVTYERLDGPGLAISKADSLHVTGWVGITPYTRVSASYGKTNEIAEGQSVAIAVFHDVLEGFTAYLGGRLYDGKPGGTIPVNSDAYLVALGATYKFDFGFAH